MNKLLSNLIVAAMVIIPAAEIRSHTATNKLEVSDRIVRAIKEASDNGRFFTVVDFTDVSWKEENRYMRLLKDQGYKVVYHAGTEVYGFNGINAALKINW